MTCAPVSSFDFSGISVSADPPPPLGAAGIASCKDRELAAQCRGGALLNALSVRNRYMMRTLERLAATFNDAGIPLLALKGAALHLTLYTRLDERSMEDLDLLVHPDDLAAARRLLEKLGAIPGEPLVQTDFCPRFHYEVEYRIGQLMPVKIDLHVRPFRPLRYSRIVPADAFWARAKRVPVGKAGILVPSVEDMLVHLATHSAVHGNRRRMWLRDIQLWSTTHWYRIDWSRFLATVENWQLALPVQTALTAASRELGQVCPEDVILGLANLKTTWRDRLALWQAPRDVDHPLAHVLVSALSTPGLRFSLAFLRAVATPSTEHLSDGNRRRHRVSVPVAHILRWLMAIVERARRSADTTAKRDSVHRTEERGCLC